MFSVERAAEDLDSFPEFDKRFYYSRSSNSVEITKRLNTRIFSLMALSFKPTPHLAKLDHWWWSNDYHKSGDSLRSKAPVKNPPESTLKKIIAWLIILVDNLGTVRNKK